VFIFVKCSCRIREKGRKDIIAKQFIKKVYNKVLNKGKCNRSSKLNAKCLKIKC
jgi:hypothetical protein